MKPAISIIRVLVGLLFIFSGLVKANDPHGLSYKMQEYFEIWGFLQLNAISLISSVARPMSAKATRPGKAVA